MKHLLIIAIGFGSLTASANVSCHIEDAAKVDTSVTKKDRFEMAVSDIQFDHESLLISSVDLFDLTDCVSVVTYGRLILADRSTFYDLFRSSVWLPKNEKPPSWG